MSENVVVDSEGFTDLEPQFALEWSVQVKMVSSPVCLLGEYLTDFLHLCNNQKTIVDLLGDAVIYAQQEDQAFSSVFNILTESRIPTISTVVSKATTKKNKDIEGPIPEEILLSILYFLFPDAEENSVSNNFFFFCHSFRTNNHIFQLNFYRIFCQFIKRHK